VSGERFGIVGLVLATFVYMNVTGAESAETATVGVIGSDYVGLKDPVDLDAELTDAQVEDMVRALVEAIGGPEAFMSPADDWVVIKPNIGHLKERGSGEISDWRITKGLVKVVHEFVPDARVTIAEGPAMWAEPKRKDDVWAFAIQFVDGFERTGYRQLLSDPELADVKLDLVDLNFDEAIETPVPGGGSVWEKYHIPRTVLECDVLINVPVMKVTMLVGMTVAMKNFVGIGPGLIYGWAKTSGYPPGSGNPGLPHAAPVIDEMIVDLTALSGVDFTVVDAIIAMERDYRADRAGGRRVRMNTLIGGTDIVAVDAVAARSMGFNPDDVEHVTLGERRGLGVADLERIKIKGTDLSRVARRFEKSPQEFSEEGHYGQGNRVWLLKGIFEAPGEDREFVDATNLRPVPGQDGWTEPVYFNHDKIDLDTYYDDPANCAAYAYAEFTAPKTQEAELWVGSDEGMKVWINGEEVYSHRGARKHRLPNDRLKIRINEGKSSILVRADQTRGKYDFSLNICEVEGDPRYDGTRVWGLKFLTPSGVEVAEAAVTGEEGSVAEDAKLLEARWMMNMATIMGALEGCLRHLGEERSQVYLMGVTGHAFRISVSDSLSMDAPAMMDMERVAELYGNLGYEVELISGKQDDPRLREKQNQAWGEIKSSIDQGVPAVARTDGFFWLLNGYSEKKEEYYLSAFGGMGEPVGYDELGFGDRGLDVLLIGEPRPVDPRDAEMASLRFAVEHARGKDPVVDEKHRNGFAGFELWMANLREEKTEGRFSMSFNTAVVTQARRSAVAYLDDISGKYEGEVAERLQKASSLYKQELDSLVKLSEMFPFMGGGAGEAADLEDPQARAQAVEFLNEALKWEKEAIRELERATEL